MAKFRSVDSSFWRHPFFRSCEWQVRDLFLFLVTGWADDEGRFKHDPFAILEAAFSRRHPVEEKTVNEALTVLQRGGYVVLYGDEKQYGFLVGWYEHQYIVLDRRTPSSLPEPPVDVPAWEVVDEVRQLCAKALGRGVQQVSCSDAVRWFAEKNRKETVRQQSVDEPLTEGQPEGKGSRREVEGKLTPIAPAANDAADDPPEDKPKPKASKSQRPKAKTPDELEAELDQIHLRFEPGDLVAVGEWFDMLRRHRANGQIALSLEHRLTASLLALRNERDMSSEGFRYGITAGLKAEAHGKGCENYVAKAARGYRPPEGKARAPSKDGGGELDEFGQLVIPDD